jgi:hypothetical protein
MDEITLTYMYGEFGEDLVKQINTELYGLHYATNNPVLFLQFMILQALTFNQINNEYTEQEVECMVNKMTIISHSAQTTTNPTPNCCN